MERNYYVKINGQLVYVTREVYLTYHHMKRREKYLDESDTVHGKVNFHSLDTDEFGGEEIIEDASQNVEEQATTNILIEKMLRCLPLLTAEERLLVDELYYKQKSEVELSKETGIPRTTIRFRKDKLLAKLKIIIEN